MMDRNYPTSGFADPLAPAAQTGAWAYERSSAPSIKPSSSYGATHLESELLHRQTYASTHQLPTYTTTHHPTGLSGVFDSGPNTTETSVMNFLSAMESRGLQAGPVSASLLPPFRTPSWQTGTNSSTTELFLTGALPSTTTFPSPATLSSYQHAGAFSSRSYANTPSSLALQDPVFSTANGLLSPHDPLLHLKPLQTSLAFDRLPVPSLGVGGLPPQSSTYRSAQESAPHLLQPQFGLLPPLGLNSSQSAPQPYGAPVFSGSIERALQRECSVIKHHQRPSSSHAAPEQLPSSQHSLQGYLSSGAGDGEVSFQQDPSRQTPIPCSPSAGTDSSQGGVNGVPPHPKTQGPAVSQAVLQQTQAYPSSSISSPSGYSPSSTGGAKAKDCLSEGGGGESHSHSQGHARGGSTPESYPSPGQGQGQQQQQSSVIASQQSQPYTSAQLPSLLSISSHSQTYITSHSQQTYVTSQSHSQGGSYASPSDNKLPSLYKTLPSFSGPSGNVSAVASSSVSQSLVYSSSPAQGGQGEDSQYVSQVQGLCLGNPSPQSYPSSHSQGAPNVSYSQSQQGQQASSVTQSQSYAAGQSLASGYPSTRAQSLPVSNSTQGYILMQPSSGGKADPGTQQHQQPQSQKYLLPVQSPTFSSASHAQALQNNCRSSSAQDLKPAYGKLKLEELPIQDLQALQQASLETSSPSGDLVAAHNNVVYVVSKMDDRYNTQSVIRSNSRSEDQLMGLSQAHLVSQVKDDRMGSLGQQHGGQLVSRQGTPDPKTSNPQLMSSHHRPLNSEELKQQPQQQNHQVLTAAVPRSQVDQNHHTQAAQTQYIRVHNAPQNVLLEPNQMILLQQPLIHSGHNPSKAVVSSTQLQVAPGQGQVTVQYLHMDGEGLLSASVNNNNNGGGGQNQQVVVVAPHQGQGSAESSKQHLPSPKDPFASQAAHHHQQQQQQQSQDAKQHHFALSSICFPEAMLLADERNILSNVDDILAATAAACGVTPQDFVKATSEGGMGAMAVAADSSKGHYQHVSPGFSSNQQHSIIANTNSLTLNGTQGMSSAAGGGEVLGSHQGYALSHVHTQPGLSSGAVNSRHDMGGAVDKGVGSLRNPGGSDYDLDESRSDVSPNNGQSSSIHPSNGHGDRGPSSESDYHLAGQAYDPSGLLNRGKGPKTQQAFPKGPKGGIKREDSGGPMECPSDGFPKKRARSKVPAAKPPGPEEENNGQPRPGKRGGGQAKRQNSRGSDTSSPSTSEGVFDSYQQQERMRQKIREVEEKQPEVKTGFIGSFLDFLKSGPKQHLSSPPVRNPNRSRKPSASSKRPLPYPLPSLPPKLQQPPTSVPLTTSQECHGGANTQQQKRLDEELQKNLETLPSFSSDEEEESAGKNQALQNSISSALSALDEPSDRRHKTDDRLSSSLLKPDPPPSMPHSAAKAQEQQTAAPKEASVATASSGATGQEGAKEAPPGQLAVRLTSVAIEGLTDEELSDSGGEGMYRERDEFVVKNEDIESLKVTLRAGQEPPAIWKVQKALLQKFVPELRDGRRVFSATNSYLGYFGDAKTMYRRVYVKFLDTVNKREYVRVCNRKPRCKPMHSMRSSQAKSLLGLKAAPSSATSDPGTPRPVSQKPLSKPRPKQPKPKAEPPPKKRRKWKEFSSQSPSGSSPEDGGEDDEFTPPVPFASRFLNTRTMKETFKSFVELLISVALDTDMMAALERENDELLLPHMKRVEGMITDNRRRLLPKLRMGQLFKSALDVFPEISVVTELKKDGESPAFKVRLSGKAYNRKNMKPSKCPSKLPLEYTVDQQKTQWFSLYHSLQHYKYHTYLMCRDEVASLRVQAGDVGQEDTVQLCMRNRAWVEGLFDRFGELLTQVQQACL